MKKRFVRFVAVLIAAVIVALGVVPVRSSAIVPLGLVQSALASYVTSAGYKLYNDQGTGQDILGSLGDLYDDYVALNNKTISGSLATLAYLANSPLIYTDNSGQICINAVAANIMQDFADWIQTEYNVPVGSSSPTTVVSGDEYWTDGNGIIAVQLDLSVPTSLSGSSGWYTTSSSIGTYNGSEVYLACESATMSVFATRFRRSGHSADSLFLRLNSASSQRTCLATKSGNALYQLSGFGYPTTSFSVFAQDSNDYYTAVPLSSVLPSGSSTLDGASVVGLGVSLAQAVADVVGQAADDDAVVVGVGAGVGATAQDIADAVASGVKAQTLNPSVSIVAESVIDTPVQPYPDIEGLGLPQLGAALTDRFPFCIPWDFVGALKLLNAEPIPPVFDVPLVPDAVKARWGVTGNTTLHVDLTTQEYTKVFLAIRWGSLISFCIGLTLLTKRLIWTA